MKTFIISLFLVQFLSTGIAFAHETGDVHEEPEATVEEIVEAEAVTNADLGVSDPGMLPTHPLYFFKEMGRGLLRAITFNSVAKTELELKIVSEKAAEAKKVAEQDPNDGKGIERALLNYKQAHERLQNRLGRLAETSENPNIDKLLDKVVERIIAHEKLFAELRAKHEAQKALFDDIENGVDEAVGEIAEKGTADAFRDRFERAFEGMRGSTLKHVRLLEIIDRLLESEQLSDEVKSKLEELRAKLSEEALEAVENFEESGQEGADRVRDALQELPGDSSRRIQILEEIRMKSSQRIGDALKEAQENLRERIGNLDEPIPFPALTEDCRSIIEFVENNLRVDKPSADIMEKYQKCKEPSPVLCTQDYNPVCGVDGKTYSNRCVAELQNKVRIAYVGECVNADRPIPPMKELLTEEFKLEADDAGFYPSSEIRAKKGSKVKLTFVVRQDRVYYAGLDFKSPKFNTSSITPGGSITVEFTADESFEFKSYWPATGVLKATGRVIVE